jgi:hypothetical protein
MLSVSTALRVSACLLSAATSVMVPAQAQQWGLLYPDGSIRNRYGLMLDGPSPSRLLHVQQTLPINRQSIDLGSGSIYRGGVLQSGPSPSRRLMICMQTGIC